MQQAQARADGAAQHRREQSAVAHLQKRFIFSPNMATSIVNPLLFVSAQTKVRRPSHILARKHSPPITADVAARRAVRVSKLRNVKRLHRERNYVAVTQHAFDAAPAVVDLREVELSEAIGRGQYSVVRSGHVRPRRSAVVSRKVAVKTTAREYAPLLLREIQTMTRYGSHPNLCGLIAVARTDEGEVPRDDNDDSADASDRDDNGNGGGVNAGAWTMHLVLEYCGRRTLTDVVDMGGPLSEEAAAATALCLLTALACLHQGGVCHRDVKPDNCIFRGDPESHELSLIDFGLAAPVVDTTATASAPPSAEDASAVSTVDFLAPECVLGDAHASAAIDVWGAGVVLYFALSGRLPFGSRNAPFSSIMGRIVAGRFAVIEGASRGATDLITRMLELEPQHRITCAEALAHPWIKAAAHRARAALVPLGSGTARSLNSNAAGASERARLARTLTERLSIAYSCGILARRVLSTLSTLSDFTVDSVLSSGQLAAQLDAFDCAARAAFRDVNTSCSGAISREEMALALAGGDASETVEVPDHIWQSSCGGGAVAASGVVGDGPSLAFNRFRAIWLSGSPLYRTEAAAAIAHSLLGLADVMDAVELRAVLLSVRTRGAERMEAVATPAAAATAAAQPPAPAIATRHLAPPLPCAMGEDSPAPQSQLPSSIAAAVAGLDNLFSSGFTSDATPPAAARERRSDAAAQVECEDVATVFAPPPAPSAGVASVATASATAAESALDAPTDEPACFLPFCSPARSSERDEGGGGGGYADDRDVELFSPFGCGARVRVRFVGDNSAVVDACGTVRFEGAIAERANPINIGGDIGVVGSYRHRGWIGVEVDEPVGVNSGDVDGVRYFNCAERCGIFVPPNACALLPPQRVPPRAPPARRKEHAPAGSQRNVLRTKGSVHRASVTAGVSIAAGGLSPLASCYLSKKSQPHKLTRTTRWSKRWFVCGDSYLRYYRSEAAFNASSSIAAAHGAAIEGPLATIKLRSVESVAHAPPSADFEVRGADGASLSMRAPSSEIAVIWAAGLRARVERLQRLSGEDADGDQLSAATMRVSDSPPAPMAAPASLSITADAHIAGADSDMPPPPSDDEDALSSPPRSAPPPPPPLPLTASEARPVTDRPPPSVLRVLARAGLQSGAPPRHID